MIGDPRDRTAYGLAVASIGLALALLVAGICWIAAQHGDSSPSSTDVLTLKCPLGEGVKCRPPLHVHVVSAASDAPPRIPGELWAALLALGGVLAGALVPSPLAEREPDFRQRPEKGGGEPPGNQWVGHPGSPLGRFLPFVPALIAVVLFAVATGFLSKSEWAFFFCATGGLALGLAIPSPVERE